MVSKLVVIFLIFCFASIAMAMAQGAYGTVQTTKTNNIEEQTEFIGVIAEGIFGKVSRFMQAKLNIILWAKRMVIQAIIRGIGYISYFILHNPNFVGDVINLLADLVRTIVLNLPHLSVPQVAKSLANLMTLPYGQ